MGDLLLAQSRVMSLAESLANVAVGYGLAVITQILVFPYFGLHTTLAENLTIGAIFTVVSIGRSYCLRRLFEELRMGRKSKKAAEA
jgi:hypothetical protein